MTFTELNPMNSWRICLRE